MDDEVKKQVKYFFDKTIKLHIEGQFQEAQKNYQKLLMLFPDNVEFLLKFAALQFQMGNLERSMTTCNKILSLDPDNRDAYIIKSKIMLPGEDYVKILKRFHQYFKPDGYVEIGVETGQSLSLTMEDTCAIGIDPNLQLKFPLSSLTSTFEMTSDDFFKKYNLWEQLKTNKVELAFIDGLHLFDQVLKDFINLEPFMTPEGIILVHDCFPIDYASSLRKRQTYFWSGDVWRIIPCLKQYRPDLNIFTIPTTPTGLGVITRMDPESTMLKDNYDEIVKQFINMEFQQMEHDMLKNLNLIPNHWPTILNKIEID